MVVCLECSADLHIAQLMPLPPTVSFFSKIQIGFTFLVPAHLGSPGQRAVKWVCVCVCVFAAVGPCWERRTPYHFTDTAEHTEKPKPSNTGCCNLSSCRDLHGNKNYIHPHPLPTTSRPHPVSVPSPSVPEKKINSIKTIPAR